MSRLFFILLVIYAFLHTTAALAYNAEGWIIFNNTNIEEDYINNINNNNDTKAVRATPVTYGPACWESGLDYGDNCIHVCNGLTSTTNFEICSGCVAGRVVGVYLLVLLLFIFLRIIVI